MARYWPINNSWYNSLPQFLSFFFQYHLREPWFSTQAAFRSSRVTKTKLQKGSFVSVSRVVKLYFTICFFFFFVFYAVDIEKQRHGGSREIWASLFVAVEARKIRRGGKIESVPIFIDKTKNCFVRLNGARLFSSLHWRVPHSSGRSQQLEDTVRRSWIRDSNRTVSKEKIPNTTVYRCSETDCVETGGRYFCFLYT